jgi:hypothetical protein
MVNLLPRSTVLVNLDFVELERLGNISWSEAVFGESGVIEFCQIELTSIAVIRFQKNLNV